MVDTSAIKECILGTKTQWRVVDQQAYLALKECIFIDNN